MDVLEFWNILCNECGCRFFTGKPSADLSDLFNSLNPDILHFVPAVNDAVAVNMAAGVALCGDMAAVLCGSTINTAAYQIDNLVVKENIPVLFITPVNVIVRGVDTFDFGDDRIQKVCEYIKGGHGPATLVYDLGE